MYVCVCVYMYMFVCMCVCIYIYPGSRAGGPRGNPQASMPVAGILGPSKRGQEAPQDSHDCPTGTRIAEETRHSAQDGPETRQETAQDASKSPPERGPTGQNH